MCSCTRLLGARWLLKTSLRTYCIIHWVLMQPNVLSLISGVILSKPNYKLYIHRTCHSCSWRVYTQSFLGVHGVTVGWPRTNGTANNERVHSFCWFLPNPFIEDLFFWRSSQGFVKTDLYPLSQGLLISVRYAVCSTRRWSTCRPLPRAC